MASLFLHALPNTKESKGRELRGDKDVTAAYTMLLAVPKLSFSSRSFRPEQSPPPLTFTENLPVTAFSQEVGRCITDIPLQR